MIKRFFAWLKSIYFHPVTETGSQPKENTVKLALVSIITSALANGVYANKVQATLTDATGAILPSAVVNFTADNGATVTPTSALTDANGQITVSLVSSTAGPATLTATAADGTTESIQVYFVAVLTTTTAILDAAQSSAGTGTSALISPQDSTDESVLSPLATMKADFEKVVAFIEHGIEVLGKDAEADLVALKNKFIL